MYDPTQKRYPTAVAFVDTVEFRLGERLTYQQHQRIRGHIRAGHFKKYFEERRPHVNRLRFHGPSDEGLQWIDEKARRSHWAILSLHVAVDVPVENPIPLHRWVEQHISMPYRRARIRRDPQDGENKPVREITNIADTCYTADPLSQKNVAIYSSRPSKILGCRCVHIELRLRTKDGLDQAGVQSAGDVRHLNLVSTWQHFVRFEGFDQREIGRQWRGRLHRRNHYVDHRAGGLLMRITALERGEDEISALLARATCAAFGVRPHRIMRKLNPPWTWPPPNRHGSLAKPITPRPKPKLKQELANVHQPK